jgi:hypothetical protein
MIPTFSVSKTNILNYNFAGNAEKIKNSLLSRGYAAT